MPSKESVRLLLALTARLPFTLQHYAITGAFLHEVLGYSKTAYFKEMRQANVNYMQGKTFAVLKHVRS